MRCPKRDLIQCLRDMSAAVLPERVERLQRMQSGPDNTELSPEQADKSSEQKKTPSLLVAALQREHPEWINEIVDAYGEVTIIVPRDSIAAACAYFKTATDTSFDF